MLEISLPSNINVGYNMGRSVDWKIHLYFKANPVMELPFSKAQTSLLIRLPQRMRPGAYWSYTDVALQIIIPTILLGLVSAIFLSPYYETAPSNAERYETV